MAMLLQKAISGSHFITQEYANMPVKGIVFIYDSSISGNQTCLVESDGTSYITFNAAQDNGLIFGVYQYLQQCGFLFYQPGSIWEIVPSLTTPYKAISTTYQCDYKYKTWTISGGCNRWAMDNKADYSWDTYNSENGHGWALYQRRNGMTGEYAFSGHRGDLMTGDYLTALQNNPCYVACVDGSRQASAQSVPDINNMASTALWSNTIEHQYTQWKNIIFSNTALYANYYRNFNYYSSHIGIEVPDGAKWGNSKDNGICSSVDYPKESDQQFILANATAQKINGLYSGKRFQLYAYSKHADIPSPGISINSSIDVQVISTSFQYETSAKGLLNRWYHTTKHISEYHYLNIPQWGGETPMFYLNDLTAALQRTKDNKSQGITWEASPAKFASLPFLLAANSFLKDNIPVDSTLHRFCNKLFDNAANSMYRLLQYWSDDKTVTTYNFMYDNKYKLPLYIQLIKEAEQQTQNATPLVKARIQELKAYQHYMILYFNWVCDQRNDNAKADKAAAICTYLAKINRMQLVNSYFLILDIVRRYPANSDFYNQYNVVNGTAYQNGNLPLITTAEIEQYFLQDIALESNLVDNYRFEDAAFIKDQITKNNLKPLNDIKVQISYTNGVDYSNRKEFYIDAPAAGSFSIQYTPHFNISGKGYINFTVESAIHSLQVIKDFSIDNTSGEGKITVSLPNAGIYILSVVTKFKSVVDLSISTNGNYFYKNGPFIGDVTENYTASPLSAPGYFYVPKGINKVYFAVNNSNSGVTGFASAEHISKAFVIKDNSGFILLPHLVTPTDSALFYIEVPAGGSGTFWQVQVLEQYRLCFCNISNVQWYARENVVCSNADFIVSVQNNKGNCITRLTATAGKGDFKWVINDSVKITIIENQAVVDLQGTGSPNTIVTLYNGKECSNSKRLGDDKNFLTDKNACSATSKLKELPVSPVVYPNPSNGRFNFLQNGQSLTVNEIEVTNAQGQQVGLFKNMNHLNISTAAKGIYWYKILVNGVESKGKLVKL